MFAVTGFRYESGTCVLMGAKTDHTGHRASASACCHEKWWWEGDAFEGHGGQACEECCKGECSGVKH